MEILAICGQNPCVAEVIKIALWKLKRTKKVNHRWFLDLSSYVIIHFSPSLRQESETKLCVLPLYQITGTVGK